MKKLYTLYFLISYFISPLSQAYSQDSEWIQYIHADWIHSLAEEGNYMWIATNAGLYMIDKVSGESTCYNNANSGLPGNFVTSVAIDSMGNKWMGISWMSIEEGCLVKYDGTNWTIYDDSNSGLPPPEEFGIYLITFDKNWTMWISSSHGLIKYDGTDWTIYDIDNSGLPE